MGLGGRWYVAYGLLPDGPFMDVIELFEDLSKLLQDSGAAKDLVMLRSSIWSPQIVLSRLILI